MTALDLVSGSMYRLFYKINRYHRIREIQRQLISHLFIPYDNLRADNNEQFRNNDIKRNTI
jgi:hypothetical protein